jgi:hypothetical protein
MHMNAKLKAWLGAGLLALAGTVGVVTPTVAQDSAKQTEEAKATQDVLIFRNGNVRYGKVISETPTAVRFKGEVAGLEFETEYPKAEILEIKRGAPAKGGEPAKPIGTVAKPDAPKASGELVDDGVTRTRYYWVDLKGDLGVEISQTPIHKALLDARDNKAEVVIFNLDATFQDARTQRDMEEFEGKFDGLSRATAIMQVLVNDVPVDFGGNPPRIVFWVKRAMGGAAFLPLVSKEIYFHPEGKLGGIGNLDRMMKGHERVVEKQISLRLQRAAGWANVGGYPEELVRALALTRTVLSVRYENGKPILFEDYPKNPGEELLTDDGQDGNQDTIDALARGEGNDSLTLNAQLARRLQVSKGTASTREELLNLLGLDRGGVAVKGRSEQITRDWVRGIETAKSQIVKLMEEIGDIRVEGDWTQRNRARSAQINKIEQLKSLLSRWKEGLEVYWLLRNRIPLTDDGEPDIAALTAQQEAIRIAQLKDRK